LDRRARLDGAREEDRDLLQRGRDPELVRALVERARRRELGRRRPGARRPLAGLGRGAEIGGGAAALEREAREVPAARVRPEDQERVPDLHAIARAERRAAHALAVHVGAVRAAQVLYEDQVLGLALDLRVVRGDLLVVA